MKYLQKITWYFRKIKNLIFCCWLFYFKKKPKYIKVKFFDVEKTSYLWNVEGCLYKTESDFVTYLETLQLALVVNAKIKHIGDTLYIDGNHFFKVKTKNKESAAENQSQKNL